MLRLCPRLSAPLLTRQSRKGLPRPRRVRHSIGTPESLSRYSRWLTERFQVNDFRIAALSDHVSEEVQMLGVLVVVSCVSIGYALVVLEGER